MKKPILSAGLLILLAATALRSHDFWLVPNAFHLAARDELVVRGQTSSRFPSSVSAVTPDRVASARLIGAAGEEAIADLAVHGPSLVLRHRSEISGQALVAVAIHPREVPESPESFRRYLELEGAPEALARYEREGLLPTDSIVRRYAKYAKTLLQIGHGSARVFDRPAGHPLEFVPLSNPMAAQGVRFRMSFRGDPVAHARGHASVAASLESEGASREIAFETDSNGEFSLGALEGGIWNVRALHIVPAPAGSDADWDVHWATFVWRVEP